MHKSFRYVLTGFIIIAFGVIIMLIGLAHGGQNKLGWHQGHFDVSQIKSVKHQVKTVDKMDLETANVPVTFETGNQKKVVVEGRITNPNFLHITRKHKQLKVRYVPTQEKGYEVGFGRREPEKLVIRVPKDMQLGEYRQSAMYGDMTLKNLNAKHVILTATNADLNLQHANMKNLSTSAHDSLITLADIASEQTTVNVNSSRLRGQDTQLGRLMLSADESTTNLQRATVDTSAVQVTKGDLKLSDSQLHGQNMMTIIDGSLKAKELPDVNLQMQTTSGKIKVAGENYGNNYTNDLTTDNQLNVDVSDGNINIK